MTTRKPSQIKFNETSKPDLLTIVAFFDLKGAEYYKLDLWALLKCAVSLSDCTFKGSQPSSIPIQDQITGLLEALWQILMEEERKKKQLQTGNGGGAEDSVVSRHGETTYLYPILNSFKGRIRRLNKTEIEFPYIALRSLFSYHSLNEWKAVLTLWKNCAGSDTSLADVSSDRSFLTEYEYLEKAIELAFLFNEESEAGFYARDEAYVQKLLKEYNPVVFNKL